MDSIEINIMSAAEARATAEARRATKVQQDINKMIDEIKDAVVNCRSWVWFYGCDYCGEAFEALIPVLKEKGYYVENLEVYVKVSW